MRHRDCAFRDHLQRESYDVVHEVEGYHVGGTNKVSDGDKDRSI
jgi:hypothetical protein